MASVLVWVIYDIVDDKMRNKVAKALKKAGLIRVTEKCFLGKARIQPV